MTTPFSMQNAVSAPAGLRLRRWRVAWEIRFAILTARAVRGRMILVLILTAILLTAPALLFVSRSHDLRGVMGSDLPEHPALARLAGVPPSAEPLAEAEPPPFTGADAARLNAAAPFEPLGPAARPFHFSGSPQDGLRARTCLAAAMLYEAGSDVAGQLAVAQVVLNRVRHPAFPNSVCGVVLQGSDRASGCQFTFTCDGALARRPSPRGQMLALARADLMLKGFVFARVGLATHYHTVGVYPWWSPRLEKIAQVGPHVFLRWLGYWGSIGAVRATPTGAEQSTALFAGLDFGQEPESAAPMPRVEVDAGVLDMAKETQGNAGAGAGAGAVPGRPRAAMQIDAVIPASRRLAPVRPHQEEALVAPAVQSSALVGARLLQMFADEGIFYVEMAPGVSKAQLRRTAELLCGGRAACRVYGWREGAPVPPQFRPGLASRPMPSFAYVREPRGKAAPNQSLADAL